MATARQIGFIRTLMSERQMESHQIEWVENAIRQGLSNNGVQQIITRLKALPRVGTDPTLPVEVPAPRARVTEEGFYLLGGKVFKVVRTRDGQRLYAKQTTPSGLKYVEGAMGKLFADMKMTPEEIAAYGAINAYCVVCSHEFEDPTSKHIGIGPKCGPDTMGKDAYKALRLTVADRPDVIAFEAAKKERAKAAREAKKLAEAQQELELV